MMRALLLALVLAVAGCSNLDIKAGARSASPADTMGGYPMPEPCTEKDPVTRLCK